jgi:hypothetical protein
LFDVIAKLSQAQRQFRAIDCGAALLGTVKLMRL